MEYRTVNAAEKPTEAPPQFQVFSVGEELYIFCPIRNKSYKVNSKPEEIVRQWWLYRLRDLYGYGFKQIDVEVGVLVGSAEGKPEFHQARYVDACEHAAKAPGAFQLGDDEYVVKYPFRGLQPLYADDEEDPDSLEFEGMIQPNGDEIVLKPGTGNICAVKSISIRWGYIDFSAARSVSRDFASHRGKRALVQQNDVLINSTGDGTIGRVAVYDEAFPAMVDGHVTVVRFSDQNWAWYVAAYLLTPQGQDQIYRYINGSSGQVEIYPQDIARVWIPGAKTVDRNNVATRFRTASRKHREFFKEMRSALSLLVT